MAQVAELFRFANYHDLSEKYRHFTFYISSGLFFGCGIQLTCYLSLRNDIAIGSSTFLEKNRPDLSILLDP